MARRDLTGAVDFTVLERMTGEQDDISEEVLGLFVQQASIWSPMLIPSSEGWRDAVHTIRGAAAGIGAGNLAAICADVENGDASHAGAGMDRIRTAMDAALADVAAYRHELLLRGLKR